MRSSVIFVIPSLINICSGEAEFQISWPTGEPPRVPVELGGDDSRIVEMDLDFSSGSVSIASENLPNSISLLDINTESTRLDSTDTRPFVTDPRVSNRYRSTEGSIGLGFRSAFSEAFGKAIILPQGDSYRLVADYEDLENLYCDPGSIGYVPINDLEGDGIVRAIFRFESDQRTVFSGELDLTIGKQAPTTLPASLYEYLLQYALHGDCNDLSRWPRIHFIMGGMNLVLTAEDYLTIHDEGCAVNFLRAPGESIALGTETLRSLGFIIDYENSRYGFCDPL